jgi:hypothetical protein
MVTRIEFFCARSDALCPSTPTSGLLGASARRPPPHRAKNGLVGGPGPAAQG